MYEVDYTDYYEVTCNSYCNCNCKCNVHSNLHEVVDKCKLVCNCLKCKCKCYCLICFLNKIFKNKNGHKLLNYFMSIIDQMQGHRVVN